MKHHKIQLDVPAGTSRRTFLGQAAAGLVTAASLRGVRLSAAERPQVKFAQRREDSVLRLGGFGDDYHMTWAADDNQYVSVCDGAGWLKEPTANFNSKLWTISGGPRDARFGEIAGYPQLLNVDSDSQRLGRYYNFGILALDGFIYQFLATGDGPPVEQPGKEFPGGIWDWVGSKLIYSPDNGRTWHNQDGSTPVVWEAWSQRSRDNMLFFREPTKAFSALSIVQMGRNYEHNTDGYVYLYSENRPAAAEPELILCRVPKKEIPVRAAYEYFAGHRSDRSANWSPKIEERAVVHRGKVGWLPSVTYNAPLGLYMMANGGPLGGEGFENPSYFGLYTAPKPWGPWTQILEETRWLPGHDPKARAYQPQIAPK